MLVSVTELELYIHNKLIKLHIWVRITVQKLSIYLQQHTYLQNAIPSLDTVTGFDRNGAFSRLYLGAQLSARVAVWVLVLWFIPTALYLVRREYPADTNNPWFVQTRHRSFCTPWAQQGFVIQSSNKTPNKMTTDINCYNISEEN